MSERFNARSSGESEVHLDTGEVIKPLIVDELHDDGRRTTYTCGGQTFAARSHMHAERPRQMARRVVSELVVLAEGAIDRAL